MKYFKGIMVFVLALCIGLAGLSLSMNAGQPLQVQVAEAANPSDSNFKGRYTTDVTITNLEELVGSGTVGTTGQVNVHDGTDYEPQTITASGAASGSVVSTGALVLTPTQADAKVIVGNASSIGLAKSLTIINDITATMINSGVFNATIPASTITSAMILDNSVTSDDILNSTIALADMAVNSINSSKIVANSVASSDILNATIAGVDMAANSVGTSAAFINTVTLLIANAGTNNSVSVDSGHVLMSYYLTTIGGINGANLVNDIAYDGSGAWTIAMKNSLVGGDAVWTLNFLSDN